MNHSDSAPVSRQISVSALWQSLRRRTEAVVQDSLHRNAFLLMLNQGLLGLFGFGFWAIVAHLVPASHIGLTTAAMGVVGILALAATLGLPNTVVRNLAGDGDPSGMMKLSLGVVAVAGLVLGALWVYGTGHFGVKLSLSPLEQVALVLGVAVTAVGSLGTFGLIARRKAQLVLAKDMAGMAARYVLVGLLCSSVFGLISVQLLGGAVSTLGGVWWATRRGHTSSAVVHDWRALTRTLKSRTHYALTNHVSVLIAAAPGYLLSAVLVVLVGARDAAYVAVPYMIVNVMNVIPQSSSSAMFAEIANDKGHALTYVFRTLKSIYLLAIPVMVTMLFVSPLVLGLFGHQYSAHGTNCLRLMALGCLFSSANYVSDTLLLAEDRVGGYFVANALGTLVVLASVVLLASNNPASIGLGWLVGQAGYLGVSLVVLASCGLLGGKRQRSVA